MIIALCLHVSIYEVNNASSVRFSSCLPADSGDVTMPIEKGE